MSLEAGPGPIVYTELALQDLERLREFLLHNAPTSFQAHATRLVERLEALPDHPHVGRPVALAPDPVSLRDLLVGEWVVRYTLHGGLVVVLRIWHQREQR